MPTALKGQSKSCGGVYSVGEHGQQPPRAHLRMMGQGQCLRARVSFMSPVGATAYQSGKTRWVAVQVSARGTILKLCRVPRSDFSDSQSMKPCGDSLASLGPSGQPPTPPH